MTKYLKRIFILLLLFIISLLFSKNISHAATSNYYITVNYKTNVVTIYSKDNNGNYTVPYKSMICSCGSATPTSGTYTLNYKYRWLALFGGVYGQYCSRIVGNILFHSVPYLIQGNPASLEYWEYDKLGTSASAGCIRLKVEDAKWIYENCNSSKVTFIGTSDEGPLGKPTALKISDSPYRDWDPTDETSGNPWKNIYKVIFDYKYYSDKYPDLKNNFGYNENELYNHWVNFGQKEGRQASPVFDPKYYLDNNSDLKEAFGDNYIEALNHFIISGINEFRNSSSEYYGRYYQENNEDLKNFSSLELAIHYYEFGYNEKRIANKSTSIVEQVKPEEKPEPEPAPTWNGNAESIIFDSDFYASIHDDLRNAFGYDEEKLYNHWKTFGIKEGRMSSIVFDPKYYLENNPDLKNSFKNDYEQAYNHYVEFGIKEGRKSSIFFDGKYYLDAYSDLQDVFGSDYGFATEHFVNFGINEGRIGSETFNSVNYRNNYADLNTAFGNSFKNYYIHYISFGISEKRNKF